MSSEQATIKNGVLPMKIMPSIPEAPPINLEEPQQKLKEKRLHIPQTPDLPDGYGDNRIVLMVRDRMAVYVLGVTKGFDG